MDWFYEYCDCEELKRPEAELSFKQFCLITHVWLKSKGNDLRAPDRLWMMEELYGRAINVADRELGLLIDCVRLALKRNFIKDSHKLVKFILSKHFDDPFLQENVLKLLSLLQDENLIKPALDGFNLNFSFIQEQADFDDFCFIRNESANVAMQYHILRKYDLLRPTSLTPAQFLNVFFDSETELIKALHRRLKSNPQEFLKFYQELVQIADADLFVSESPAHVAFFRDLAQRKPKLPLSLRQFHVLLRLKCEVASENHQLLPFLQQ